ncbi:MAG: dinitrogenase iron-molybdenum cofactor biosynthesis protein [Desulfovibrio sp.]|jgi:predicted Fe-Mo cluster-binding NifX family protein|nr:dinitrogenase iron-molybdenum cofactor biosynthesis protein [Desulfovibrio sp.]
MRIAVAADGPRPDSNVEPVFGRAEWFVVTDTETEGVIAVRNAHRDDREDAGRSVAQLLSAARATVVLCGECGPKARLALADAGIEVLAASSGLVGDAVTRYRELVGNVPQQ